MSVMSPSIAWTSMQASPYVAQVAPDMYSCQIRCLSKFVATDFSVCYRFKPE